METERVLSEVQCDNRHEPGVWTGFIKRNNTGRSLVNELGSTLRNWIYSQERYGLEECALVIFKVSVVLKTWSDKAANEPPFLLPTVLDNCFYESGFHMSQRVESYSVILTLTYFSNCNLNDNFSKTQKPQ